SSLGRFMTPDPIFMTRNRMIDPPQWNLHAYVRNNPVTLTDPTALDFTLTCSKNNGTTCHAGYVYYKDENGDYQKTVSKSDKEGNVTEQSGNKYKGSLDGKSVTFADANGTETTISWIQASKQSSGIKETGSFARFEFPFMIHNAVQNRSANFEF